MIYLNNVSFSYPKGMPALVGVSATIGAGIHLLIGPNGAGKTTLLMVMAGLLQPQQGSCLVDGNDLLSTPVARNRAFFLSEDCKFPLATIADMARLHAPFYPNFSMERLVENLAAFGLTGEEPLTAMSLGTRKKANISYALALGCDALLLDEPANGMDIDSKKALNGLLAANLRPEQAIVISTHTIAGMKMLFDSVSVIRKGHICLSAYNDEITSRWAFVHSGRHLDEALYEEGDLGGFRAIVPNVDGIDSEIDYELLYSAVISGKIQNLPPAYEL